MSKDEHCLRLLFILSEIEKTLLKYIDMDIVALYHFHSQSTYH